MNALPNALSTPVAVPTANRFVVWGCLAIAVAAFALQTIGPNLVNSLDIDEQVTYYIARGHHPETVRERAMAQSATPPLYFWLADWSLSLGELVTGDRHREWWLRFPAWLAMLASLAATYLFASHHFGNSTGAAAAILLACHGEIIHYATQARPYTLGVLESLVALFCLVRLRTPDWRWTHVAGFLAANVALLWTHYLFGVLLPVELFVALLLRPSPVADNQTRPPVLLLSVAGLLLLAGGSLLPLSFGVLRLIEDGANRNWITTLRPWSDTFRLFAATTFAHLFLILGTINWGVRGFRGAGRWPLILAVWVFIPSTVLWLAGWHDTNLASLAQMRYIVILAGPAVLFDVLILRSIAGNRWVCGAVLLFVVLERTPWRIVDAVRSPLRHGDEWRQAAHVLDESGKPGDVVLVYSGLTEARFVLVSYADEGYQEYTTSRLSDFYLRTPMQKLTLPIAWTSPPGQWTEAYLAKIDAACRQGNDVWLVIAADTDFGQRCETQVTDWLQSNGLNVAVITPHRIARVLHAECGKKTNVE